VRALSLSDRGQTILAGLIALLAGLAISLWFTVPAMLMRAQREETRSNAMAEAARDKSESDEVRRAASGLRFRARRSADLLNRVAFLYRIPAADWPPALGPDGPVLSRDEPGAVAAELPACLVALERGLAMAQQREAEDAAAIRESPAILPLGAGVFELSAYFGPRRSPWTNEDEFLTGVEIASPAGTPVVAPADATVVFAGTVRRSVGGRFWELGNVVLLSHGERGATVFGHLLRIDVRRGQRLTRGSRLGAVGATGWALSPELHYEYWRPDGKGLRPTDPLFAVLDQPLSRQPYSLAQMDATWAPDPLDPLPGISVGAEEAGAKGPPKTRKLRKRHLGVRADS